MLHYAIGSSSIQNNIFKSLVDYYFTSKHGVSGLFNEDKTDQNTLLNKFYDQLLSEARKKC